MADEELGIRLRVKGLEETRRNLANLNNELRGTEKTGRMAERAAPAEGRAGQPREGGGTIAGSLAVAGGVALANFGASVTQALRETARAVFDPGLTQLEKQVRIGQGALQTIPFVGGALSEIGGVLAQPQINAAQGTTQRLAQIFGPAFEAFGAQNPNLTIAEMTAALKERFGPSIERLKGTLRGQAVGQEAGNQLLADAYGDNLNLEELKNQAEAELSQILKSVGLELPTLEEASKKAKHGLLDLAETLGLINPAMRSFFIGRGGSTG